MGTLLYGADIISAVISPNFIMSPRPRRYKIKCGSEIRI